MFFSRAHNNPTPQTRLALEQTLGTIKKQEEKMSVVGDIVDMKVDGPTRIDFSEQVKNKMLEYFYLLSENILGLQKMGWKKI